MNNNRIECKLCQNQVNENCYQCYGRGYYYEEETIIHTTESNKSTVITNKIKCKICNELFLEDFINEHTLTVHSGITVIKKKVSKKRKDKKTKGKKTPTKTVWECPFCGRSGPIEYKKEHLKVHTTISEDLPILNSKNETELKFNTYHDKSLDFSQKEQFSKRFREQGKFGSFPIEDDYSDESSS